MALELRLQGDTYERIAGKIGYSYKRVHDFVQMGLGRLYDITDELAERLRKLQRARLERIYTHAPNVTDARSAAIMLKVLESEAKLLGTDAPYPIAFPPAACNEVYDFDRLTVDEQRSLHALLSKCAILTIEEEPVSAAV